MPIKIAICDDTAEDIVRLSGDLSTYDPSFEIVTYTNGETLIEEFLDSGSSADILFLDIYMPGIDGIKTAQSLRGKRKDLKIIFVSSSQEHYPQAYEVFAFNYLLKPFDRKRLYSVLERAIDEIKREHSHKISFSYKSALYSVDCRDILYLESRDKLLLFHLADGSTSRCYGKLDEIAQELPMHSFIRCHQSFIVNTSYVTEMAENHFRLGQVVIGISKKYLKPAKDQYYAYLFSHMGRASLG
ncbi:Two component system, signal transduction response regulator [Acididesulfobacillus acetoxydans]|uniref:Stage 0 sporulation protein A homolog n=1 Tax=Acididesulfobacillus acetoxydans TaxID=1561005 RepID=A0A8S0VYK0_9FIRM|nr:LytTR family DNA-binding domain-containing protein [Acididesulfobacillus acetoxydans]CAA7603103.1 Two component system, signal transduction response regulator [Acididesulfobacillus acetoxydans]CEJ05659.1 Two component transcriptional regulator, LytTR [Acididesulfobacillus acetoxydans]